MRVAGHTLVGEGAPHNWQGDRMSRGIGPTRGFGKCSCGEVSDNIQPSDGARKRWHREHKAAAAPAVPGATT